MIALSLIDDMFDTIGTALTIEFIRSDQNDDKPNGVYCTYKLTTENVESNWNNVIDWSQGTGQNTKKTYKVNSDPTISIMAIGEKNTDLDICHTVCRNILRYLRTNQFQDFSIFVISPGIEDRTVFLNGYYEYKKGFDIRLHYTDSYTSETEEIKTIGITPTIDKITSEEEQPEFIINKP